MDKSPATAAALLLGCPPAIPGEGRDGQASAPQAACPIPLLLPHIPALLLPPQGCLLDLFRLSLLGSPQLLAVLGCHFLGFLVNQLGIPQHIAGIGLQLLS
jgi:hypothetical protein